MLQKCR